MQKSEYELEREANIARNKALLEQLELKQAVEQLGLPSKRKAQPKSQAKPVQPAKRQKRERNESPALRRQSARLRKEVADPNETRSQQKRRLAQEEERRAKEAEELLESQFQERMQKQPRHQDLLLSELADDELKSSKWSTLTTTLQAISDDPQPVGAADPDAFTFTSDKKHMAAVEELREKLKNLKVVSRAKVTDNRVYSAAYHPTMTKDLILFGDKHGQLGIWDAQAPPDEVADEDGEVTREDAEDGKYWRLQLHWPASPKSSISCIKIDPSNADNIYTSAYDCTIRSLSFSSNVSREIFAFDDVIITGIDVPPSGREMWISDVQGRLTHLDLREDRSKARSYGLSYKKIGSVSINPIHPSILLTASNDRMVKLWDTRKLQGMEGSESTQVLLTPPPSSPGQHEMSDEARGRIEFDQDTVQEYMGTKSGKGCLRGTWEHGQSATSAYWDPCGRSIVSTSYDNTLRLWDIHGLPFKGSEPLGSFRPFSRMDHNCRTGKWLTLLRAKWSPNADVYPHFTIANMNHSLDIFSCKGDLITRLSDPQKITAVQAVTCSHPHILERAVSGNASGRCVLWAPPE